MNCTFATALDNQGVTTMDTKKNRRGTKKHAGDLLSIPGVTG
jgi:ribosome-associated protein YbcJ (S4-like RNA binding protein)